MNLLWHIVAKDVRRLWLPTALWLAFVGGTALYFAILPGIDPRGYDAWLSMTSSLALLMGAAQFFIGFVLSGVLVLEDPVLGTDAFWPTRPISRARLLAAKAFTAVLLFVVAPSLALMPAWGVAGFSLSEMASAAVEAMLKHANMTAFALAMGGLAANLAQFLFCALAVAVLHFVSGAAKMTVPSAPDVALDVRNARNYLIQIMVLPAFAAMAVHQYLSRSRKRGWVFVAGLLAITALIRNFWPWRLDVLASSGAALDADVYQRQVIAERSMKEVDGTSKAASETRIQEGAFFAAGTNRVKILQIVRGLDGTPTSLVLEERDSWLGQHEGWNLGPRIIKSTFRADRYFLRTKRGVQLLEARQGERAVHSSLSIAVSWIDLPPGTTDEMLADAVLMKVRYEKQ